MKEIMTEEIIAKNNIKILVEKRDSDDLREISIRMQSKTSCRLHWGMSRKIDGTWKIPSPSSWPSGSIAFGEKAVQTPFTIQDGENRVTIKVDRNAHFSFMNFALFYPDRDTWDNNLGKNYHIALPEREKVSLPPQRISDELIGQGEIIYESDHDMDGEGKMSIAVVKEKDYLRIILVTNIPGNLMLHWGVAIRPSFEWRLPPDSIRPEGTKVYDDRAVQTPFKLQNNMNQLILTFHQKGAPAGIPFVLTSSDEGRWLKNNGQNFYVPVGELLTRDDYPGSPRFSHVAREIIKAEMGRNSWTLMHRFNLCYDLLDSVTQEGEGLALLLVWMRYSFLRQLDWQRNYNTKPKELSHAQDRLTLKLAALYRADVKGRELIRLIMSTLGRGGEGQRIRDEILQIMHRNRIKEVAGHFLEEWHQKLHNNTTPDDIEICRAYIEFLKSDGNVEIFYRALEAGGVTKKRLESFERPIVTPPDFVPHLKDALIYDFENYLRLFRSVHSGMDLESAAEAAGYVCDDEMRGLLNFIVQHREDVMMTVEEIVGPVTSVRGRLNHILNMEKDHGRVRDILYLDIALEEFLRIVVERHLDRNMHRDQLVEIISVVLRNAGYSCDDFEFTESARHWERLKGMPRFGQDWSLHAKAVLDRLGRAIADMSDRYYGMLQDKAVYLGKAFHAERWVINLFSEEIVRGRLTFILSLLVHYLEPILRKSAKLGDWQIISPGQAMGVVEVVDSLRTIQDKTFEKSTIIITENVKGDEEPPEGLRAVITSDLVDLVAHVAIRARNAGLLFATCYDRETLQHLKSLKGRTLALSVNASGDVVVEEAAGEVTEESPGIKRPLKKIIPPESSGFALSSKDFHEHLVGGKSLNLLYLQGKLPDWMHSPASVALPFGVLERVLALDMNKDVAGRYHDLISRIEVDSTQVLSDIRKVILSLEAPEELVSTLRSVIKDADLHWPENWGRAWDCIKAVWASKWNDRAYVSRRTRGIPHEDLFMAVLIQQVVEAEYAFVIHTVNPFTGDENELYAEVVPGLGETLVGNYPGRALGFTSGKKIPKPGITSYPSKTVGLFGAGVIFRSDSNGEDLAEYAGAGLYDSVLLEPPREVSLKYSEEPLIWNEEFRNNLLKAITDLGNTIEKIMGSPQDIEGAYAGGKYYVVQTRPQV
jgi:alpha-glucan,water dikinase